MGKKASELSGCVADKTCYRCSDMKTHHFSHNVKAIRLARGLTQAELSSRSGISQASISEIETGASVDPSYRVVRSLADALGIPIGQLFVKISQSAIAKYRQPDIVSPVG